MSTALSEAPVPAEAGGASAYIIEIAGTAAGIVAADRRGFRFHAAAGRFNALDGQSFRTPAEAERAARRLIHRRADARPAGLRLAAGGL